MRHAFLIIAHNNPEILKAQIDILKSPNTDFYYHLDSKMVIDKEMIRKWADGHIYFVDSKKIRWGHFSQIDCELRLIQAAVDSKKGYDYYHLLSGVDLPIKKFSDIDSFFEQNKGKEFIHFDGEVVDTSVRERISFYHIFPGREHWQRVINGLGIKIQRRFKIDRLKRLGWIVQKGANWFSITSELAQDIIAQQKLIRKVFRYSFCGDEVFLQTFVYNSSHKDHLYIKEFNNDYKMCMRYIDWQRGNPYIFKTEDKEQLMNSDFIFARKFDYNIDADIVQILVDKLKLKKDLD